MTKWSQSGPARSRSCSQFASYENFHYMVLLTPVEAFLRLASPMVHILFASIWDTCVRER